MAKREQTRWLIQYYIGVLLRRGIDHCLRQLPNPTQVYAWLGIKAVLGNWAPSPGKKEIELRTQQMTRTIEARRGLKNLRSIILRLLRVLRTSNTLH